MQQPAAVAALDRSAAWKPCEYPGLLKALKSDVADMCRKTRKPGSKPGKKSKYDTFMFACTECAYMNDRLYHAKMHHKRIHVNHGRSITCRRKYTASEKPELSKHSAKSIASAGALRLLCRRKIAAASRREVGCMRRVMAAEDDTHCTVQIKTVASTQRITVPDDKVKRHVLTFGESSIDWAPLDEVTLRTGTLMQNRTADKLAPAKAAETYDNSPRFLALQEIASGFTCIVPCTPRTGCELPCSENVADHFDVDANAEGEPSCATLNPSHKHFEEARTWLDATAFSRCCDV